MRAAFLLFTMSLAALAQPATEAEAIRQGLPASLQIEGGLSLVVTRDTSDVCFASIIENFGDWLFSDAEPLLSQQITGEPCRKLWSAAWGQTQKRLAGSSPAPVPRPSEPPAPSDSLDDLRERLSSSSVIAWEEGNEYSDTFFHNGFRYKTIQFSNLFVAASLSARQDFRGYTAFLFLLTNKGTNRLDFDPLGAVCICEGEGEQGFLPFEYLKDVPVEAYSAFVRANSLGLDDNLQGILTFRGRCDGLRRLRIPIGRRFVEFPF